jgi:hypothetical protein
MESNLTPDEAAAALAEAERSGARLAADLRLPRYFHRSLAIAISLQIATTALGVAIEETWAHAVLGAGVLVFVLVAGALLVSFRRTNGAWVGGLASRVVFGSGSLASTTYCLALGAAVWAAFAGAWWLVGVAALAGGVGYAISGERWLRAYRADPAAHSRGESAGMLAAIGALALAGLVLLAVVGR